MEKLCVRFPVPSKYTQKTASLELAQDPSLILLTGPRKRLCLWIQGSHYRRQLCFPPGVVPTYGPWSLYKGIYNVRSLGSRETRGKPTAKGWNSFSKSTRLPRGGQGKAVVPSLPVPGPRRTFWLHVFQSQDACEIDSSMHLPLKVGF